MFGGSHKLVPGHPGEGRTSVPDPLLGLAQGIGLQILRRGGTYPEWHSSYQNESEKTSSIFGALTWFILIRLEV